MYLLLLYMVTLPPILIAGYRLVSVYSLNMFMGASLSGGHEGMWLSREGAGF